MLRRKDSGRGAKFDWTLLLAVLPTALSKRLQVAVETTSVSLVPFRMNEKSVVFIIIKMYVK